MTEFSGASPAIGRRPLVRLLVGAIAFYQAVRRGRPTPCRFVPSCSEYGREALETHGAARGLALTARRLGRCRPGGGDGIDLVPPRRQEPSHV